MAYLPLFLVLTLNANGTALLSDAAGFLRAFLGEQCVKTAMIF
jgi:hypothetical protein